MGSIPQPLGWGGGHIFQNKKRGRYFLVKHGEEVRQKNNPIDCKKCRKKSRHKKESYSPHFKAQLRNASS